MAEAGTTAVETITQSELESVIEECDTTPLAVRVVPDASRYVMIVFAQGDDATELHALLDVYGWDALIERLSDWDHGQEAEDDAVIYDELPDYGGEQSASVGAYTAIVRWHYNYDYNYVALYRELPAAGK